MARKISSERAMPIHSDLSIKDEAYREFTMLLCGSYLRYLTEKEEPVATDKLCFYALKEIDICLQTGQPYHYQK